MHHRTLLEQRHELPGVFVGRMPQHNLTGFKLANKPQQIGERRLSSPRQFQIFSALWGMWFSPKRG